MLWAVLATSQFLNAQQLPTRAYGANSGDQLRKMGVQSKQAAEPVPLLRAALSLVGGQLQLAPTRYFAPSVSAYTPF